MKFFLIDDMYFFFKAPACMLKTILWLTQFVCTVVNNFSYDLISAVSKLMFIKFYSVTCSYSNTKHNFTVAAAGLINKFNREMTSAVFSCLHCWVIKPESKKGNIFQPTWGVVLSLKQSSTTPFSLFSDIPYFITVKRIASLQLKILTVRFNKESFLTKSNSLN